VKRESINVTDHPAVWGNGGVESFLLTDDMWERIVFSANGGGGSGYLHTQKNQIEFLPISDTKLTLNISHM
jgi:hypothetical protein